MPYSPHFGLAHALCLGLAPWLAAEVPHLVRAFVITLHIAVPLTRPRTRLAKAVDSADIVTVMHAGGDWGFDIKTLDSARSLASCSGQHDCNATQPRQRAWCWIFSINNPKQLCTLYGRLLCILPQAVDQQGACSMSLTTRAAALCPAQPITEPPGWHPADAAYKPCR